LPADAIDLTSAVSRRPLVRAAEALSGATLESVSLRDGRRLVVKHLPVEGDFMTHVTNGAARLRTMWTNGALQRIGAVVDHTILDLREIGSRDVVIMRDATNDLLPPTAPVSRHTSRRLLAGLADMHASLGDVALGDSCPIEGRYAMAAPALHATYTGPGRHPMADTIVRGWQLFQEHVDRDVAAAVAGVHREPRQLGDRLRRFPATLLHGDPKLENLGLARGRLVAIDWGELTGSGPREIDVAWYAQKGSARIGCTPDEVFSDYEAASGEPLDPDALDLACVGALAQMGFRLAVAAYAAGVEPAHDAGKQLAWWTARVRAALGRIGSI
jgi:hypothetical protein